MAGSLQTQQIQERAYAIWERAGRPHGNDTEHWFQAEAELADEERRPEGGAGAAGSRRRSSAAGRTAPRKSAPTAETARNGAVSAKRSVKPAAPVRRKKS